MNKLKNYWWVFTTLGTIIITIISCTLVVAQFYYNIEDKYAELMESVETNKQMSLKAIIWNSEIPIGEQLSACDTYINSGFNSLTKKHCELILDNYNEGKSAIN